MTHQAWKLVPVEATPDQIETALRALTIWRKGLSAEEAIIRRSAPIQSGRVWLASASPEEKAVIRYNAMLSATPPIPDELVEAMARAAYKFRYGGDLSGHGASRVRYEIAVMRAALNAIQTQGVG